MANEVLNSRGNSEPGRVLPQPVAPELASDLVAEFRKIPILSDLSEEGLRWLADHAHEYVFQPGEVMVKEIVNLGQPSGLGR